ncbi:LysR substrate-binding domain-containing protein, partial [Microbacterium sp. ZW T5_45]|uniref:LysR substrate-binding domain-containing protein n=1 Tax=Microbacterium sp. ZW T5_45 TaxID=3378080 RepID=UPI003851E7BD
GLLPRRPSRPSGPARKGKAAAAPRQKAQAQKPKKKPVVFDAPVTTPEEPRTFRLGAVAGATPGKWIDAWKQRMPHVPLELVPVELAEQLSALDGVDAALVRLPLDDADTASLHVIALYDELPVVVASIDSHLLAADDLTRDDLAGEVVIPLLDDALPALELPDAKVATFAPLTTGDAIATAASGVGILIVPMSLARLHHRKDVDHRVLTDGPTSTVALAWPRDRTTPDVETFVGIVRGRTANSSR